MKAINTIELTKFFFEIETEYQTNQQKITELEAKQSELRKLLSKRNRPSPRPLMKPVSRV